MEMVDNTNEPVLSVSSDSWKNQ